jgi:YVTN family beta-propeller protein
MPSTCSPNGATAYVANYGSGTITPITTATGKPGKPIKVGSHPDAIVVAPNGKTIYVLNGGSGTMTTINAGTLRTTHTIDVGKDPVAAAITPDGKTIYIVANVGVLALVATASGKTTSHIKIGKSAESITITP